MPVKEQITHLISAMNAILFPELCINCQQSLKANQKFICLSCSLHLPYENNSHLNSIFWGRVDIAHSITLLEFKKGNITQKLLHQIKYKGKRKLAKHLGEKLGNKINSEEWCNDIDFIIPIPLHPKKEQKRGYNQAFEIAKGIAEKINIPIENNVLKRVSHNITQTSKSKFERWENVKRIFEVKYPEKIKGKHILVIDDAITTGATLESALRSLKEIPNCTVSIATLAIAI